MSTEGKPAKQPKKVGFSEDIEVFDVPPKDDMVELKANAKNMSEDAKYARDTARSTKFYGTRTFREPGIQEDEGPEMSASDLAELKQNTASHSTKVEIPANSSEVVMERALKAKDRERALTANSEDGWQGKIRPQRQVTSTLPKPL